MTKSDFVKMMKSKKAKFVACSAAVSAMALPLSASAEEVAPTYFQVTDAMVAPISSAINSGLSTVMPIGIAAMASFIGINIVKRVIYSFI